MASIDSIRVKTGEVGFCPECGETVDVKVLPGDRLQRRIALAVARRGYRKGWSPGQFLARNAAKMMEEMAEFGAHLFGLLPEYLWHQMLTAGDAGKWQFDHGYWPDRPLPDRSLEAMVEELYDMQVVLANMADALSHLLEEDVDLMKGAARKAENDVGRGVRSGDGPQTMDDGRRRQSRAAGPEEQP